VTEHGGSSHSAADDVLDLLNDREFCADARRAITDLAAIAARASNREEGQRQFEQVGLRFFERWGVPPPPSGDLVDNDARRPFSDVIASGRWGLVPVFSSMTNRHISGRFRKIRTRIHKQHKDTFVRRRDAQLVRWLEKCGFDRPTIASAVYQRRTGLQRLTKEEALGNVSDRSMERERDLLRKYRAKGLSDTQAEQRTIRRLRGSEAPAAAAVRMAHQRYLQDLERLNQGLEEPVRVEPLSYALTCLFRIVAEASDTTLKKHALAVRDAFILASGRRRRGDASSQGLQCQTILAALHGVVPIFPWTTATDLTALVKKLRIAASRRPKDGPGTFEMIHRNAVTDALRALLEAIVQPDPAALRRAVFAARASFLEPGTS
jgi:hypothetical protein